MTRLIPLLPALLATAATAGEFTVKPLPFTVEQSFPATAMPAATTLLRLEAKAWADFEITKLAPHGTKAAAGDVLVAFDTENIDKKLTDTRRALAAGELSLAQAELDFANFSKIVPLKLDAIRRAARDAKEEHEYFTKIRRKATEEGVEQSFKRAKNNLGDEQEELKQLQKMYDADDLTEETEEIILVRQKQSVEHAEFALRMATLDHDRTLKIKLPREAEALDTANTEAALELAKAEVELPRQLELKKLALEAAKTSFARDKEDLAKLEADRKLFEFKAPAAGYFYYGPIDEGRWTTGELVKALVVGGKAPLKRSIATFIPATAKLGLVAFIDEATSRSLSPALKGKATVTGRDDLEIPLSLTALAVTPGADGRFRADLETTWPADLTVVPGATAEARFVTYDKPAALVVPAKALTRTGDGWTVELKLADGKTEARPVKRGRTSKDQAEILSGLEAGQVIVTP